MGPREVDQDRRREATPAADQTPAIYQASHQRRGEAAVRLARLATLAAGRFCAEDAQRARVPPSTGARQIPMPRTAIACTKA
jgi:hypothetical protein